MGNIISGKTYIEQFSDACDINTIVNDVNGLASNSASPTDLLILNLKNDIRYQTKNFDNKQVFMKYWINDDMESRNYIRNNLPHGYLELFIQTNDALNYELMVYRDIIRVLVDEKICTNFVQCLGSSSSCSTGSILNLISKNTGVTHPGNNLLRNIMYTLKHIPNRPSVTNNTLSLPPGITPSEISILKNHIQKFSIGCVISEYRTGIAFEDWYMSNRTTHFEDMKKILYQVCCGCYAMHLSRVVHNDLHLGNVRLATSLTPLEKIFTYKTDASPSGSIKITFECSIKAMIYDFDRAYSSILGINNIVLENCTPSNSNCNKIREGFDFTYFIVNLIMLDYNLGYNYDTIIYLIDLISVDVPSRNSLLANLSLSINTSTKTITRSSPGFKHASACMSFGYKTYKQIILYLAGTIALDNSLPDAKINNNTIYKNLFNSSSGVLKNRKNKKDCSTFTEKIKQQNVQISTLNTDISNLRTAQIQDDWEDLGTGSFPRRSKKKQLVGRRGRSPSPDSRRKIRSPISNRFNYSTPYNLIKMNYNPTRSLVPRFRTPLGYPKARKSRSPPVGRLHNSPPVGRLLWRQPMEIRRSLPERSLRSKRSSPSTRRR